MRTSRMWFRFRLRTLVILILMTALAMGMLVTWRRRENGRNEVAENYRNKAAWHAARVAHSKKTI